MIDAARSKFRLACVNLPHRTPVVRRYMCSYNSPTFLFPPLELLSTATAAREQAACEVRVVDAIAERLDVAGVAAELSRFSPDLVLTILGFEIFEHDIGALRELRRALPRGVRLAACGYYATLFSAEVLELADLDFVLRGEPEASAVDLVRALSEGRDPAKIAGVAMRGTNSASRSHTPSGHALSPATPNVESASTPAVISLGPARPRLSGLDDFPHPDYGLVNPARYSEFMLPRPFAALQTARGCPYPCTFCVRSYGQKLVLRSPEAIEAELAELTSRFGLRAFRFIDDTFTAVPARTLEICERIRRRFPGLVWSCLSRIDTIDAERARALREGGCVRVYIGIESGADRILRLYGKEYGADRVPETVATLKREGIEVTAFFMTGHPEETEDDFAMTCGLVRTLDLDYATIFKTIAYPGTQLFEQYRDEVEFSLYPYRNGWKSPQRRAEIDARIRRFLRAMYLRRGFFVGHARRMLRRPAETVRSGLALFPHLFGAGEAGAPRSELI